MLKSWLAQAGVVAAQSMALLSNATSVAMDSVSKQAGVPGKSSGTPSSRLTAA